MISSSTFTQTGFLAHILIPSRSPSCSVDWAWVILMRKDKLHAPFGTAQSKIFVRTPKT